jgi:hypothetical protein
MSSFSSYRSMFVGIAVCFILAGQIIAADADRGDSFGCRNNPENCLPGDPPEDVNKNHQCGGEYGHS